MKMEKVINVLDYCTEEDLQKRDIDITNAIQKAIDVTENERNNEQK